MKNMYLVIDLLKKILKRLKSIDKTLLNIDDCLHMMRTESYTNSPDKIISSDKSEDSNTDNIIGFK